MITIDDLIRLSEIVKIKKICEECNINYSTIMAKINRKTELSIKESELIYTYLLGCGLKFQDISTINIEELKKSNI
jgi:hypothetical protein